MRVRIIFRGLVLFEFEKPRATSGQERGALTAWLVNDPNPMGAESNMHKHSPTVGIIGRTAPDGERLVVNGLPLPPAETRFGPAASASPFPARMAARSGSWVSRVSI